MTFVGESTLNPGDLGDGVQCYVSAVPCVSRRSEIEAFEREGDFPVLKSKTGAATVVACLVESTQGRTLAAGIPGDDRLGGCRAVQDCRRFAWVAPYVLL